MLINPSPVLPAPTDLPPFRVTFLFVRRARLERTTARQTSLTAEFGRRRRPEEVNNSPNPVFHH